MLECHSCSKHILVSSLEDIVIQLQQRLFTINTLQHNIICTEQSSKEVTHTHLFTLYQNGTCALTGLDGICQGQATQLNKKINLFKKRKRERERERERERAVIFTTSYSCTVYLFLFFLTVHFTREVKVRVDRARNGR